MQSSSRWVRMRDLRWQSCCRQHKENYCRQCHTKLPHKFSWVLPFVSEFLACVGRPCAHLTLSSTPNRRSCACIQAQGEADRWLEVLHLAVCRHCSPAVCISSNNHRSVIPKDLTDPLLNMGFAAPLQQETLHSHGNRRLSYLAVVTKPSPIFLLPLKSAVYSD